ncbi:MAG: response regulator [Mariprofundaceae bacterium]|nr:response regulator [Mariprofundaceae bacterium]
MQMRFNLSLKLRVVMIGLTIFAVLSSGILTYFLASSSADKMAREMAFSQLEATRSAKTMEIEDYFHGISKQLLSLANSLMVIEAMTTFIEAEKKAKHELKSLENLSEMHQAVEKYYKQDFSWQYIKKNPTTKPYQISKILGTMDDSATVLQYDYIANKNPLGQKDKLNGVDNIHTEPLQHSEHKKAHEKYHFHLRQIQQYMGYYDLFLIEPTEGRVIYSVFKEVDFGTRLKGGPWANTGLAQAYRSAMQLHGNKEVGLTDMARYTPSYEAQSIFLSAAIEHEGTFLGVLVVQIPISEINRVMTNNFNWEKAGGGQTGESYLVGSDLTMRSSSRFHSEDETLFLNHLAQAGVPEKTLKNIQSHHDVIGYLLVDTPATKAAFKGEVSVGEYEDYRNVSVLAAYTPLNIPNLNWVLVSEVDAKEAFAAVRSFELSFKQYIMITVSVFIFIALIVGTWFARRLMQPMREVTTQLKLLSQGEVGHDRIFYRGDDEITDLIEAGRKLDRSMQHTIDQSIRIAQGDFSHGLDVCGESDALGQSLLQMNQTLQSLSAMAAEVARGNYNVEIHVQHDKDELRRSLLHMTQSLRESTANAEEQDWLKSCLAEISLNLQGQKEIKPIATMIMQVLPPMLGVSYASFYLWEEELNWLAFQSHYACSGHDLAQTIKLGEGLTGQCALEKKMIMTEELPSGYLYIQSSLGKVAPQLLIEVPLLADTALIGVIELASVHGLSPIQEKMLKQLSPILGMALQSVQQAWSTEKLLEESRALTEELHAQEEELRLNNDELLAKNKMVEEQRKGLAESTQSLSIKAAELERASQYKSDFLSNMSHELRTPLNSLLILSDMLAKNKGNNLSEKQVKFAQTIYGSGIDLLALINDILDLAKVEAGKMVLDPHRFPLRDLTDAMQRDFSHVAEGNHVMFVVELADTAPEMIFSDSMRVKQVLKNLLSNAFKFTSTGEVSLKVEVCDAEQICFTVTDSGAGIAQKKLNDIFEAFQQEDGSTSRKYGGTGLGLSICRELSSLLGGGISVQSEQGVGSSFSLVIPISCGIDEPEEKKIPHTRKKSIITKIQPIQEIEVLDHDVSTQDAIPNPMADDRDSITSSDRTIQIIEDDETFSEILQTLVREHGFKAINAMRGDHALSLAHQYVPDAILLDLQLPILDGMSVLDRLKQHPKLKHIPVHIISCMDEESEQRVLNAGALSFVHKPADKSRLDHTINEISAFLEKDICRLLIAEDDPVQQDAMSQLLASNNVELLTASTGQEALDILRQVHVDCMVLDLSLPDMSGEQVLEVIAQEEGHINQGHVLPIIVHTGKDLNVDEVERLQGMSKSIIVKGSYSPDRLLAETSLFLHQLEEDMSKDRQSLINHVREQEVTLAGNVVLLVDDDIRNIYSLSSYLEGHELIIHTARNGLEALSVLERHADKISLVLMDVMMPEMDGHTATREIRKIKAHQNLPVIALTAKAMKGDREQCIAAGASDYITKPIDTDKLISLMRVWLHD